MLLIDPRAGSGTLVEPLKLLGIPAQHAKPQLEFADAAFVGEGRGGVPWLVGVEVKTIEDMVGCIVSGRFAGHQLPGLIDSYDEAWLLVEGAWRSNAQGVLEVLDPNRHFWYPIRSRGRGWMYREVQGWLLTMACVGGVRIWHTYDRPETVRFLACLYRWWTEKSFEQHKSLRTFVDYKKRVVSDPKEPRDVRLRRPTLFRRIAKELVGIGWDHSIAAEQHFGGDIRRMINADVAEWLIPQVAAKPRAKKIVESITKRGM